MFYELQEYIIFNLLNQSSKSVPERDEIYRKSGREDPLPPDGL